MRTRRGRRAPWRLSRIWNGIALGLTLVAGCARTYAPPPRWGSTGAPGSLAGGQMQVRATTVLVAEYPALDAGLALGAADWLFVDVGVNWLQTAWVMPYAGVTFELVDLRDDDAAFVLDADVGGAIGVGGERCGNRSPGEAEDCDPDEQPDGRSWTDRLAGGGYAGVGIGLHIGWFSTFVRDRVQGSVATNVPATVWNFLIAGVQAIPADPVRFWLDVSWGAYANDFESATGVTFEAGLSVTFDAWE